MRFKETLSIILLLFEVAVMTSLNSTGTAIEVPHQNTSLPAPRVPVPSNNEKNETKRVVSHSMFYTPFKVVCFTKKELADRNDPDLYMKIDGKSRPRISGTRYSYELYVSACFDCYCDGEGQLGPSWKISRCKDGKYKIFDRCKFWYGCRCVTEMISPEFDPKTSIEDYQRALNWIPSAIKQFHPEWRWEPRPGISLSWERSPAPDTTVFDAMMSEIQAERQALEFIDWSTHEEPEETRYLVPGEDPPYYLFGPTNVLNPDDTAGPSDPTYHHPLADPDRDPSQGDPEYHYKRDREQRGNEEVEVH